MRAELPLLNDLIEASELLMSLNGRMNHKFSVTQSMMEEAEVVTVRSKVKQKVNYVRIGGLDTELS